MSCLLEKMGTEAGCAKGDTDANNSWLRKSGVSTATSENLAPCSIGGKIEFRVTENRKLAVAASKFNSLRKTFNAYVKAMRLIKDLMHGIILNL